MIRKMEKSKYTNEILQQICKENDLMFVKGQPGSTSTSTYGGAIYWNGINGTLNNCSFIDNFLKMKGNAFGIKKNEDIKEYIRTRSCSTDVYRM